MPANIVAKSTDTKVKKAEPVPSLDSMLNVRGREKSQQMMVEMKAKTTVRQATLLSGPTMVFMYFALTRTCKP